MIPNVFIPSLCNNYPMRFTSKVVAIIILSVSAVLAHGETPKNLLSSLPDPLAFLYYALWISGLAIVASVVHKFGSTGKKIVFVLIAFPVAAATLYLAGHTVYLNIVSETGGPVHWHADYEVWICDKKLDLTDPMGFDNKVGSPVFHEHNDDRIHVEGVIVKVSDAELESYFDVIGGELRKDAMSYPTEDGRVSVTNNVMCNGKPAALQAFVYKTKDKRYTQEELLDFPHYVLSPHSQVPPGDCIIIEFDEEKNKTDKICETYKVAIGKGDLK